VVPRGRMRCTSCSDSSYPTNYEDSSLLLEVRTRHLRTPSISEQIQDEYLSGCVVYFCRSRGHGFIRPDPGLNTSYNCNNESHNRNNNSGDFEDIFVHISDIDSDYVPRKGDKVSYRLCPFPPKFEKYQAVNVKITSMSPQPHNRWDSPQTAEDRNEDDLATLGGDV